MIIIASLSDNDHGRWVIFRGDRNDRGRIKSWNERFIYVVFCCGGHWDDYANYSAAPTLPEDLEFE